MRFDQLVRLISQQWAIHPDVLETWCQILDAKLAGNAIPPEFAAAGGRARGESDELFVRDGNVAIIPVVGTLVKANSLFSCDATYADVRKAVAAAERAKGIDATILDGDTPGGTVAGAQETGDFVYQSSQRQPIYGWIDDLAASAGYWLLAQTRMIGAHAAADTGSIGVLTVNYDRSGRDQQIGVRRTVLAVGDFKAAGNDTGPLSPEEETYIMGRLHATYDLFKAAVNRGRPQLSIAAIHDMQSRVYKSAEAKKLGLIDHIMGREEYIDLVKRQTRGAVTVPISKGAKAMTLEEFKAQHHDLHAQIVAAARMGMIAQADADTARAQAVTDERDRVVAILGIPGPAAKAHQGLLIEGIKTGLTAGDVSLAIQGKEADLLANAGKNLEIGAVKPAPPAEAGGGDDAAAQAKACGDVMETAAKSWQARN